jgi:formylglycine-generating enzyme required for sulfatase activity
LTFSLRHPVEMVDWLAANEWLRRQGLLLPTEAQWEYACRAGSDEPWSCGKTPEALDGYANLMDQSAQQGGSVWTGTYASFADGYVLHAPVGSYLPNGFGLHDVHGNVWEWCLDTHEDYVTYAAPGSGLRVMGDPDPQRLRVQRGGGYGDEANHARSAYRGARPPQTSVPFVGLRAARAIDP